MDLREKSLIDNISDEDDIPQASTPAVPSSLSVTSSPIVFSLVADYESEDNGK